MVQEKGVNFIHKRINTSLEVILFQVYNRKCQIDCKSTHWSSFRIGKTRKSIDHQFCQ